MKMLFENVDYIVNKVKILDKINISITTEKFTSIVGANGSGKTTLLNLLTSNINPSNGEIIAPNHEEFSYIPQAIQDPPFLQVFEIVLAGMNLLEIDKKYKYKLVEKYLSQCGIKKLYSKYFYDLSEGEKQRVWLAFCLSQSRDIIIMDEPLSSIDQESKLEFYKLLKEIQSLQKTIILVTHDINSAIMFSDEIIEIDDGKIIFSGPLSGYTLRSKI
ncbi:MAG: hypothetical protein CL746_00855 [Chloroflexi bacterium]|nr:hypothetical protein [Chloroflexota bacterium]|tara:strand:+ start:1747 stop:2397 length:651 start_codon:yes stop_codon:yes gene_type:complete